MLPSCFSRVLIKACLRLGVLLMPLLYVSLVGAQTTGKSANGLQDWQLEKAYEQALYHYFQGDFFQALSQFEALHSQSLKQLPEHLAANNIEPELLKGGISLAYGLEDQAAEIFTRLLTSSKAKQSTGSAKGAIPEKTEALAWMLLGKTYYQKRQFSAASQALEQINPEDADALLPAGIRDEWLYLKYQLLGHLNPVSRADLVADESWLEGLSRDSIYRDYVQYNQALGLLEQDRLKDQYPDKGIAVLSALGEQKRGGFSTWLGGLWAPLGNDQGADAEEREAIKDRANLTLAYTYLQQQQPRQAQQAFEQVRMQSLDSQAALLGYGWAAATDQDYSIALGIWQQLRQSTVPSQYVLEAYLASAFVYEKAFAPVQAVDILQAALTRYQHELGLLQAAKKKVADDGFIRSLVGSDDGSVFAPTAEAQTYLNTLLVSNDFRAKLAALEQSITVQQQLEIWQQRMGHYHLMLNERQDERQQRAKQLQQNSVLEQVADYQAKREQLAARLELAQQQGDGMLLIPAKYLPMQHRLKSARARHLAITQKNQDLKQAPLHDKYAQRLGRLQGILAWQASELYEVQLRKRQKQLKNVEHILTQTQGQQDRLLGLLADRPEFVLQRQRIGHIEDRLSRQVANNNHLQGSLLAELRSLIRQMLQAHIEKIQAYRLQAQLAVVRLNDQAFRKAIEEQQPASQVQEAGE